MTKVALRDLVDVAGGGTPRKSVTGYYGGGIPWVTPKDMKRPLIGTSEVTLTDDGVRDSPAKLVPEGSVLVVVRSGVLKHTLPVALTTRPVTINQDMKALTPRGDLDPSYLARMLKALQPTVLSWVRATTADNFPIGTLLDFEFDLPPLPEQRRIAAILDHAHALRDKRRQVLVHLSSLTQSTFTEMFSAGDFDSMTAGVLMPKMRNGVSPATDGTCDAKVLTLSSVTRGLFDPSAVKPGVFAIEPPAEKRITDRDFLMCRGNGNKALVGVGTYSRENRPDLVFPDTVIAGTVDTKLVTMPFLEAAWKRFDVRAQIEAVARTTNGTYKVNQQTLSKVLVPVPPLDLQKAFAAKVTYVTQQHAAVQRASAVDDELFASLQSRAFRGEL